MSLPDGAEYWWPNYDWDKRPQLHFFQHKRTKLIYCGANKAEVVEHFEIPGRLLIPIKKPKTETVHATS